MLNKYTYIYEYQEILFGQKDSFSVTVNRNLLENLQKENIGIIWRYACEKLLGWDAADAVAYMNADIMKALHLDSTLVHIDLGFDDGEVDFKQILSYAFPEQVHFDFADQTIREYKKSCHLDEYSGIPGVRKYRKGFFHGTYGPKRAAICLEYAVDAWLGDMTIKELYHFFGDTKKASDWLKEVNLLCNTKNLYNTPIDYFHYSLDPGIRDDLLYNNEIIHERLSDNKMKKKINKNAL